MRTIALQITAGEYTCDDCTFLRMFSTGLVGEKHPQCDIFDQVGAWGERNMKRHPHCLSAERRSRPQEGEE